MALVAALAASLALGAAAADCGALAGAAVPGGHVVTAEAVDGVCRVTAQVSAAAGSRIGVHVWLPLQGWSGRYVQLGTGGFAGTVPEPGMAAEVARGSAVGATDTGHVGADGFDARWAADRPEAVIDYGYRSIKAASDVAGALVARVYGRAPARRYFVGCSNGGRQALMAAQRYPDDWEGILAGAPALRWTEQLSSFARIQHALRRPDAMIQPASLPAIAAAARKGRRPPVCRPGEGPCLTPPQQAALAEIARAFDPVYAGEPGGWDAWIVNADPAAQTQATFAEQFFRHMVLDQPDWRLEDLTPADLRRARALSPILDAIDPDLSRFRRRGGKLILYAGLADPVISPRAAIDYHRRAGSRDFSRLFQIPGMLHCQGGREPDAFGQSFVSPPLAPDPEHDIRRALEAWVEEGRAPDAIVAAKYVDDEPAKGVAATRRIVAE